MPTATGQAGRFDVHVVQIIDRAGARVGIWYRAEVSRNGRLIISTPPRQSADVARSDGERMARRLFGIA